MTAQENINRLILLLLEGEQLNKAEQADLINWLKEHPEDQKSLAELSNVWINLDSNRELTDELIDEQWQKLHKAVISRSVETSKVVKISIWNTISRYAAIFILGLLVSGGSFLVYQNYTNSLLSSQIIEVPYGSKSHIHLADGSEVILNAGSKLVYNSQFGKKTREVSVEGEAYFKVAKNPNKPFVVKTSDLMVKAYGTEFNVRSYGEDNTIEATLIEGSISVTKNNSDLKKAQKEFFLQPREQVIFHKAVSKPGDADTSGKKDKLFISKNIDPNLYTAWVNDKIHVKSESMKNLAIMLERKYNVKIHLDDKELQDLKFSGVLENETIEQVMVAMRLASSVNFRIKNREIWLFRD